MTRSEIDNMILPEKGYEEAMDNTVLPYLNARMSTGYCEREGGRRIFYAKAAADSPRGIVIISHGYTETIEKHLETIYYFLRGGYHVFMPEHCGHGRSYRLCRDKSDLSLVYVNDYMRYVEDLLFISRMAAKEFPGLPLCLYGHSMGGGIAAAAAAHEPSAFSKLTLSSPMIRPSGLPVPWSLACAIVGFLCLIGKKEAYIVGHHTYDGLEQFADSASSSEARFHYYKKKRDKEPLFQMSAGSYGWFWQTIRLSRYLLGKAYRRISCPVLIFQAENDSFVSKTAQDEFVKKLKQQNAAEVSFIPMSGTKHEIFNSRAEILKDYWAKILN